MFDKIASSLHDSNVTVDLQQNPDKVVIFKDILDIRNT